MNRPEQIKAVFVELRSALGTLLPAGELLRLASALVVAYSSPEKPEELEDDDRLLQGVDEAMRDGGWRLLEFAIRSGISVFGEWPDDEWARDAQVRRMVGRLEWARTGTG